VDLKKCCPDFVKTRKETPTIRSLKTSQAKDQEQKNENKSDYTEKLWSRSS
jgi:hypothetical protein